MKLHQLRYAMEVARQGLNVSAAAEMLHTSQPGISSQIKLLEEELNVQIFQRKGKRLTGITEPGQVILNMAQRILREMENIKQAGSEFSKENAGSLTISTTHTQARYKLPPVIQKFTEEFPKVRLRLQQGSPAEITNQVMQGLADIAIATESITTHEDELITLPCYQWNRCVIMPPDHPLLKETPLTIESIAKYPIITYDFAFTGRSQINKAFAEKNLEPNVVLTAIDSDVIKTYVELGMGIGLLASMAFEPQRDKNLCMIDAAHLFEPSTTYVGIRRGAYLRGYIYAFIQLFAPHLDRKTINAALSEDVSQA